MSRNGKGPRIPGVNTKALRDNWPANLGKPKPRDWVCVHCQQHITQAEFTGMRAFTVIHNGKTAAQHSLCGS